MKLRIEATLVKSDNLFIHTEYERHEKSLNAAAASSIMFLLVCKPWTIQAMKMQSRKFSAVTYYIWKLGATTILD